MRASRPRHSVTLRHWPRRSLSGKGRGNEHLQLSELLLLGGSIVGVLALVLVAWLLRLGGTVIAGEADAKHEAEAYQLGFTAVEAFVSGDGKAALVRGVDGEFIVLKVHGANVAARRLEVPLRVKVSEEGVVVATGERMFGNVALRLSAEGRDKLLALV